MSEKTKFIITELWQLTIGAAFQRSSAYKKRATLEQKDILKKALFLAVLDITDQYAKPVDEKTHIKNIQKIIIASRKYGSILNHGELSFGVAQKILNLYLKYLWCLNMVKEPPHCPIDRGILIKVAIRDINWTSMTLGQYRAAIKSIREIATQEHKTITQWELEKYND